MHPLKIGAALDVDDIADHRDWLFAAARDLEIQDFLRPDVLLGDWPDLVARCKAELDGFEGRLGIHGPFYDLPIHCADPELQPVITARYLAAVQAAEALGATQMVLHSPFTIWDHFNFDDNPATADLPSLRDRIISNCQTLLAPVVRRAEDAGVTLVLENCDDVRPEDRLDLAKSFDSDAVRVSIDTGHAFNAHKTQGAPSVEAFIESAGPWLAHVHVQDTDGSADRHWAPGDGTLPWPAVFAALAAQSAEPHLVLELRHRSDVPRGFRYLVDAGVAF